MMIHIFHTTANKLSGSIFTAPVKAWCAALALLLFTTACVNDDILSEGTGRTGAGGHMSIEIPLAFSQPNARTRSAGWENDLPAVDSVWVGVFDNDPQGKGQLVGSAVTDFRGNSMNSGHTGAAGTVPVNIFIRDKYPKIRVVGVANYAGVKGSKEPGGELRPIAELLQEVKTWEDYIGLTVDTRSATAAAHAVMSGIFSTNGNHSNGTVDNEGNLSVTDNIEVDLLGPTQAKGGFLNGYLHLRRLVSQINVVIDKGPNITLDEVSWQACNLPTAAYLQEHTAREYDSGTWDAITPNAADRIAGEGYVDSDEYGEGDVETDRNRVYAVNEEDRLTVKDGRITFSFWQYDNKHIGLDGCTSYTDRDVKFAATDVYSSLCPSADDNANNQASYFVIRAQVKDERTGREGKVSYIIHEGYCNNPDASAATDDKVKARDFSCFRNTNYTYNVTINGINSILVKVFRDDNLSTPANPAASGQLRGTEILEMDPEGNNDEKSFYLSNAQRAALADKWRIVADYRSEDLTYTAVDFGYAFAGSYDQAPDGLPGESQMLKNFGDLGDSEIEAALSGNQFYDWVVISDGASEWTIREFAETGNGVLTHPHQNGNNDINDTELRKYTARVKKAHSYSKAYDGTRPNFTGTTDAQPRLNPTKDRRALYFFADYTDGYDTPESRFQVLYCIEQKPIDQREPLNPVHDITLLLSDPGTDAPVAAATAGDKVNATFAWVWEPGDRDLIGPSEVQYTVFVDGQEMGTVDGTGNNTRFTSQKLSDYISALTAGKHTVTVRATDNSAESMSSPSEATANFFIYPTRFEWNFSDASFISRFYPANGLNGIYYGVQDNIYDGAAYYGLEIIGGGNMAVQGDNRLRTNGAGSKTNRALKFTALHDGAITLRVANTGNSVADTRKVTVADSRGEQSKTGGAASTSPATITFEVAKGEVYIYTTASLDIYSVIFEHRHASVAWNFADWTFTSLMTELTAAESTGITDFDREVDGLHIVSGAGRAIRGSNSRNYIQTTGMGSPNEQVLWFEAPASGTVTVEVTHSGSTPPGADDERYLCIQTGDDTGTVSRQVASDVASSATPKKISAKVTVNEPTKIYIYTEGVKSGVVRIYSVSYVPD